MTLVLWEADLINPVFITGIIHRLAQIVVELGSREPVAVVVVSILDHALFYCH